MPESRPYFVSRFWFLVSRTWAAGLAAGHLVTSARDARALQPIAPRNRTRETRNQKLAPVRPAGARPSALRPSAIPETLWFQTARWQRRTRLSCPLGTFSHRPGLY